MNRKRVYCLTEGQSESMFIEQVVAPYLGQKGIDISAPIVTTRMDRNKGRHYKGGGRTFGLYLNDLRKLHRQFQSHADIWLTTMIDVYRLPEDFPGVFEAKGQPYQQKVETLKMALAHELAAEGIQRFIPYLSLHEFETLLYADIDRLALIFPDKRHEIAALKASVATFEDIEAINDTPNGAPSKRIAQRIPVYERYKASEQSGAVSVLEAIGLPALRQRCRHFDAWLSQLEQLSHGTDLYACR